jgi:hypothetical protein
MPRWCPAPQPHPRPVPIISIDFVRIHCIKWIHPVIVQWKEVKGQLMEPHYPKETSLTRELPPPGTKHLPAPAFAGKDIEPSFVIACMTFSVLKPQPSLCSRSTPFHRLLGICVSDRSPNFSPKWKWLCWKRMPLFCTNIRLKCNFLCSQPWDVAVVVEPLAFRFYLQLSTNHS